MCQQVTQNGTAASRLRGSAATARRSGGRPVRSSSRRPSPSLLLVVLSYVPIAFGHFDRAQRAEKSVLSHHYCAFRSILWTSKLINPLFSFFPVHSLDLKERHRTRQGQQLGAERAAPSSSAERTGCSRRRSFIPAAVLFWGRLLFCGNMTIFVR